MCSLLWQHQHHKERCPWPQASFNFSSVLRAQRGQQSVDYICWLVVVKSAFLTLYCYLGELWKTVKSAQPSIYFHCRHNYPLKTLREYLGISDIFRLKICKLFSQSHAFFLFSVGAEGGCVLTGL